jgi:putative hydrolase of the HAD superfamily
MTSERHLRQRQAVNKSGIASTRFGAVIFDLWDTLVDFPWELAEAHFAEMAGQLAVDTGRLRSIWRQLEPRWETMPLTPSLELLCHELDVREADILQLRRLRLDYMRQALQPRPEVTETLRELRQRGLRLGLITACSGDVPLVWSETPFAGLFDTTVFSCAVGFCKPDPRIYKRALDDLGVSPSICLYIGDGGHDELAGATRVGMTAALLQRRNESTRPQAGAWEPRIKTIPELLRLVDA